MQKNYSFFCPQLELADGDTANKLEALKRAKSNNENQGGSEVLAVLCELTRDCDMNFFNYIITENSAAYRLMQEAADFFGSCIPPSLVLPVANATGALTASLQACDVSNSEVITTSFNFPGVVNAIINANATPKFVDIDSENFCMDLSEVEKAISPQTKAIVVAHLNQCMNLKPLQELISASGQDITLIQDGSVAFGSTCNGKLLGTNHFGDRSIIVFSLASSKTITGLGGALMLTPNQGLFKRVHDICYQGIDLSQEVKLSEFGANYKINDLNAAIACEQLARREQIFFKRKELKKFYDAALADLAQKGKIKLQQVSDGSIITHYAVAMEKRNQVGVEVYKNEKIQLGAWFTHHNQDIYMKRFKTKNGTLPVTEALGEKITFLPFHTGLDQDDIAVIVDTLSKYL